MFVFRERFKQMIRIRSIFRMPGEENRLALSIKNAQNGRFCNIKFQNFPGEHAPDPPSELRPLNLRTQVYSLCTQVQTGLGKTLRRMCWSSCACAVVITFMTSVYDLWRSEKEKHAERSSIEDCGRGSEPRSLLGIS